MHSFITKNKPVIKFLAIFLTSYVLFSALYHVFLNSTSSPDSATKLVSDQTIQLLHLIGYQTNSVTDPTSGFINLFVKGNNIAGISEGCNAISIMILFLAFVFSFTKKLKPTLLFSLLGVLFIHFMNIIRIVILVICIYHYPEYSDPLHNYVFPAMIYGVVFLLWMYWINSFKKNKT